MKQVGSLNAVNYFYSFCFSVSLITSHPPPCCQLHQLSNRSGADEAEGLQVLEMCPGQTFQVSLLLSHLLATPAYTSDVLLQPYLSSWDELVKYDLQIKQKCSEKD